MSFNLYSLIIQVCKENNVDVNLEQIRKINDAINNLISRGTTMEWIKLNLSVLI